ncbi:MAG: sensor histidine kinase, partial [Acidimicrobiales bacterium]
HLVKNNLQTISSLLRLQARRLPPGEGRHALDESERRVRSIALVHEILSRDTRDEVDFNQILPSLVRLAEDMGPEGRVRFGYSGEAGRLHGSVATPLAVVVTELLQNAAEHAFPHPDQAALPEPTDGEDREEGEDPRVDVVLDRQGRELRVSVRDNGKGLPPGFSVEDTSSLGLSIVRGLVRSQLGGRIEMWNDSGAVVDVVIPVDPLDGELPGL